MDVLGTPWLVSRLVTLNEERLINRKRRKRVFLRRWTLQTPTVHRDGNANNTFWGFFFAPTMACVITLLLRLQGYGPKITILALKSKILHQRKISFRFCCIQSRVFKRPAAPTANNWLLSGAERLDTKIKDSLHSSGSGEICIVAAAEDDEKEATI